MTTLREIMANVRADYLQCVAEAVSRQDAGQIGELLVRVCKNELARRAGTPEPFSGELAFPEHERQAAVAWLETVALSMFVVSRRLGDDNVLAVATMFAAVADFLAKSEKVAVH